MKLYRMKNLLDFLWIKSIVCPENWNVLVMEDIKYDEFTGIGCVMMSEVEITIICEMT